MVIGFKKQFEAPIKAKTKIHTIREDQHNRWKPGMKMHQATGVRTKYYRCFNETTCVSTQAIIMHLEKDDEGGLGVLMMQVGKRKLNEAEQEQLAVNDGFANLYEFKKWWYPELAKQPDHHMKRKIIHWTDFRY